MIRKSNPAGRHALPVLFTAGCVVWSSALFGAEPPVDFAHDVVPILKQHCLACHGGKESKGGFSLNTRELILDAEAAVPGQAAESRLIEMITEADPELRMPPKERDPLADKEIALLRRWVEQGLKWEAGFTFAEKSYEPPLRPRRSELPAAVDGRDNPIDRLIDAYLSERKLPRPAPISDAAFARRAYLDLVGLLPEPEQLEAFIRDSQPDKRQRLIEQLLSDDIAYAEHWLTFWNDLLRNDYTGTGFITGGRKQITRWLYDSLVNNKPYDQFTRELISPTAESEGFIQGIRWRGNVNASQTIEVQFAQNISQAFLGINMKCASCHDSFIDRWKLSEAYGLAAVYSAAPLEVFRCDKPTGETAKAAWIFPELGTITPEAPPAERLQQLAGLMTHPENGRFTRTIVNRLWHRLMGRGIVHPVDAMQSEPWNADLLDYLAVQLADNDYDLKQTLALIGTSQAYQSASPPLDAPQDAGSYVFRGPLARRLTAEQFVDAVWQITGAAPQTADAQVLRVKLAAGAAPKPSALAGRWVWSNAEASAGAKAGESVTFRRPFELPAVPARAVAVITCDNSYTLYINGQKVQADDNWETVETLALERYLKQGPNEVVIVAVNGGSGPNPAGLYFEARFRQADESEQSIATDADWQWTPAVPRGNGTFAQDPGDWQPAALVQNPGVWTGRVDPQLMAGLEQGVNAPRRMMRASLVKSDALMRALGRPNRDQIVSMRPSDLTTLEAIDLANGQVLADAIARGAREQFGPAQGDSAAAVTRLFQLSLTRDPTPDELAAARELLSTEPSAENWEDLLWAVLMLPEFQLVR